MPTKDQVKELWRLCFEEDEEDFIEMYFRLRYNDEVSVVMHEGEKVISALQMIPYPMTFCGHIVQTSYISGACTHPDFRGKGVMRNLLTKSFTQMWENGIHFSTLIPADEWLFDYYKNMEYAPVFRYKKEAVTDFGNSLPKDIRIDSSPHYQDDAYQYLSRKLSERPCCIQHTASDYKVILADLTLSNGCLFVARRENHVQGIAIAYRKEGEWLIHELFAEDEDTRFSLLRAIRQCGGDTPIYRIMPCHHPHTGSALGMARIICAKEVLQLYAATFANEEMHLKLWDEQLPQNNGYYYIYKGICQFDTAPVASEDFEPISIDELTDKILSPLHPYMSLMLN